MQTNWYEHFFFGVALDLWRKAATLEQTQAEADFLEKTLEPGPGARLLDVPCGNGRHALALAARGYQVTGIDLAEEFIGEAREQAAASGCAAAFLPGDMRRLPWHSEFDGAYCFGNSFGYLDYEGTRDFAAALSRTLKTGARFVLETAMAAEAILPSFQARRWFQVEDILFLIDNRYQAAESRMETEYTFVREGKAEKRMSSIAVYTVAEIRRLLEHAGLSTVALYGSLDRQPFQLGSQQLYLVARKE